MKFLVGIIILCSLLNFEVAGQTLTEINAFGSNPGNLKMFVHVPKQVKGKNVPLVVVLHGCSQRASNIANQSGWNNLADQNEFIVLYPQQKVSNNGSLCFNWFLDHDTNAEGGESESIFQMIEYMLDNYEIQSNLIYAYGLSAGAAMTTALLANYPETFTGGAVLAGGPFKSATNYFQGIKVMVSPKDLSPEEWGQKIKTLAENGYPKLIVLHGEEDKIVNIQNSEELIEQWSYLKGIQGSANRIIENFEGNELVTRSSYVIEDKEEIIYYRIKGIGHTLPIDPGKGKGQGGESGMFALDIDFFSTYYIARDFSLIKR